MLKHTIWDAKQHKQIDVPFTEEEEAQRKIEEGEWEGERWKRFRRIRDIKLQETDWWAVSDREMTQEQINYRQALRDSPVNTTNPDKPTWPTFPE